MSLLNPKNKVPEHQRFYQAAYKNHVRLWKIHPRSNAMLIPYQVLLYGSLSAALYAMGRKITGHNTFFGDN